ncbi:MAG: DUF6106 family protein [Defluviitaleaceae bacterium]|nr:DUF6106 family protein [Defluviitaleaceae bacterium]
MNDVFKEQIVRRKPTGKDKLKKAGLIVAVAAVFLITISYIGQFALFVTAAAGFGAFLLIGMLNVEFEYVFTNGELDIDAIFNRTRRKRMFSGYVKDFEIMAHIDDRNHTHDYDSAQEVKNYSSGETKENTYAFLANYKGKRQKIIIEPNEMMVKAFSTALTPRKFIKKA